jgi:hypothetical protein
MFLIYEFFLGLSRGEQIFGFGKCDGFRHDHPWIELPRRSFFAPSFSNSAPLYLLILATAKSYDAFLATCSPGGLECY